VDAPWSMHSVLRYKDRDIVLNFFKNDNANNANLKNVTDFCQERDDCPAIFVVNSGLHSTDYKSLFETFYAMPQHVLERMVWRETNLQHFQPRKSTTGPVDGLYKQRDDNATHCLVRANLDNNKYLEEQHMAHSMMVEVAANHSRPPLPYISLASVMVNSGRLYPGAHWASEKRKWNLDCTHHIYTPLYWDAIFDSMASHLCGFL
jgi:hypothetical protein